MSFILDALKKSEAERQRKSVPGFADIPDGRAAPRTPRLWWVLGGLLAINAAVIVGVFYFPESPAPVIAQPAAQAAPSREVPAAGAPAERVAPPFSELVADAKRNRPAEDLPTTTEPQRQYAPAAAQPTSSGSMAEDLATLDELRANGSLQLPELHLDIHVYSDQPAERFVFINMSKYTEREALGEGPVVREIRPDGVVLEHSGTRFLMPRQ